MSKDNFFNTMPLYSRFAWITELALMGFFLIVCCASVQHNNIGLALISGFLAVILLQFCIFIYTIEYINFKAKGDTDGTSK